MGLQPSMPPLHSAVERSAEGSACVCLGMYGESLAVAVRMNRPLVMKWMDKRIIVCVHAFALQLSSFSS